MSFAANFVAKTFIYTGVEAGAGAPGAKPGQPGQPGVAPPAKAAGSARGLKARAEGRGVE
jgi:hypothetical protein